MRVVAVDTETYKIRPGLLAPRLICVSWAEISLKVDLAYREQVLRAAQACVAGGQSEAGRVLYLQEVGLRRGLLNRADGLKFVRQLLLDPDVILVLHNGPYDFGVLAAEDSSLLPLIFDAYKCGRIRDTKTRQRLYEIAHGSHDFHEALDGRRAKTAYSLADLVMRHSGRVLPKADTWRLRYAELEGVPISEYPEAAAEYAMRDAEETLFVFDSQELEIEDEQAPHRMPDETRQTMATWVLHLMSVWGLRTDKEATHALRDRLISELEELRVRLRACRFVRSDETKDTAAIHAAIEARCQELGMAVPRTLTGRPSMEAEFIRELGGDLAVLAEANGIQYILSNNVPVLLSGNDVPINTRYETPLETGRTSSSAPNLQNPPRKGNVREAFVPRPGCVFVSCDYDTLELRTWAQVCYTLLGESELREALIRGEDPHASLGAELIKMPLPEFLVKLAAGDKYADDTRQFSKIPNFGLPGGMGADALVEYAKGYGYKITREYAVAIIQAWKLRWRPEKYFRMISNHLDNNDTITHCFSGFVRGKVGYTQACNSMFQSLAASGAKDALWSVSEECYVDPKSPLFGCRPVIFLHDEIIMEAPNPPGLPEIASNAAKRLQEVMVATMQKWCPDVPIKASPVVMRRWYKGAKAVRDAQGNLLPVRPVVDAAGNKKWVADVEDARRAA